MQNLTRKLKFKQIVVIVQQLPQRDKLKLLKQLEQETWAMRLEAVVHPIRNRMREANITETDINCIVEEVRQRRYESRSSRL